MDFFLSGLDLLKFPHIQPSFIYDEKHLRDSTMEASQQEATSIESPHSTDDLLVTTSTYGIPAYLSKGTQNKLLKKTPNFKSDIACSTV